MATLASDCSGGNWLNNKIAGSPSKKRPSHRGVFYPKEMQLLKSIVLSLLLHGLTLLFLEWQFGVISRGYKRLEAPHGLYATFDTSPKQLEVLTVQNTDELLVMPEEAAKPSVTKTNQRPASVSPTPSPAATDELAMENEVARYYARHELDYSPRMIESLIAKNSPLDLALSGYSEQGRALFEIWINESGGVDRIVGVNDRLSDAAYSIIKTMVSITSFIPARIGNQRVKSKITVEIVVDSLTEESRSNAVNQL